MMLTRLAVGLEPLNALDAAHRSPRSVSGIGSPAEPVTRWSIKRNKELSELSNFRPNESSRTRYYIVDLHLIYIKIQKGELFRAARRAPE